MVTFDEVLPTLLGTVEPLTPGSGIGRLCAVRDLRGQVRLVAEAEPGPPPGLDAALGGIEDELQAALGPYFVRPILSTHHGREKGKIARALLDQAAPWENPRFRDNASGEDRDAKADFWWLLERRLSKESWLGEDAGTCPWPLRSGTPLIVTFHSFKGGVGRTTALASCAWQLAKEGRRVAVLDLDLEAPGVSTLLEAETHRGLLDVMIDALATGRVSLENAMAAASALPPAEASLVDVIGAGTLGLPYLEKLARLDYASSGAWKDPIASPVESALKETLVVLRRERRPDVILLDARAGLHDLAGLSLHGLAHVDVLFTRWSAQALQGLDLTLNVLARRKRDDLRAVVVHAMAPRDPESEAGRAEVTFVRERVYSIFQQYAYGDDVPALDDETAGHWPWQLPYHSDLEGSRTLASLEEPLFSVGFRRVKERIEEIGTEEEPE